MVDKINKFDLNGLLNSFKSIINPTSNTPNPSAEDAIGIKIAELCIMVQELEQAYVTQGKQLAKINKLFNEVYEHLQQLQKKPDAPETTSATVSVSEPENSDPH